MRYSTAIIAPICCNWLRAFAVASLLVIVAFPSNSLADTQITAWGRPVVTNVPTSVTNAVGIAAGDGFAVALLANGTLKAWGTNSMGITNVPAGLSNVVAVSAAGRHVVALRRDGKVIGWGNDTASTITPRATNCVVVAAGPMGNLAIRKDRTVLAWPDSSTLADGLPKGLTNVTAIAAGAQHGLAVTSDGRVVAWGNNSYGQLDVPADLTNVVSVAAGERFSVALTANGTLVAWGQNNYAPMASLTNIGVVRAIAASRYHLLAIREDTSVFAWGLNTSGQTNVPPNLTGAVLVAASDNVSVALGGDVPAHIASVLYPRMVMLHTPAWFEAVAHGAGPLSLQWNLNGQPIPGATERTLRFPHASFADVGIYSLSVSNRAGVDVTSEVGFEVTQISVWGTGLPLTTNLPSGLTNLVTITGGISHFVGLTREGTVVTWGNAATDGLEPPAGLSNVVAVAAGDRFSLALAATGQVFAWGSRYAGQVPVPEGLGVVRAIAAGQTHAMALKADGTVASWGEPGATTFAPPAGLDKVVGITASFRTSAALQADGRVVIWPPISVAPVNPAGITNAISLVGASAVSVHHMLALLADRSVVIWGYPKYTPKIPALGPVENMVGNLSFDVALMSDGTIQGWGDSTNPPANLPPIAEVAANGSIVAMMVGVGAPYISSQLVDRKIAAGSPVAFKVRATGEHPLTYQWRFEGAPISGATDSLLVLSNTTLANAGNYSIVVSNGLGTAETTVALSVLPALITQQPLPVTNLLGSSVVFETDAIGESLRFQWQLNGVDLPGETNRVLHLENVGHRDGGLYRAIIVNQLGSVQTWQAGLSLEQVAYWGSPAGSNSSAFVTGLTNFLGISAGAQGSLAINDSLTLLPIGATNVIAASAGSLFTLMLHTDGRVGVYGENPTGPTLPPEDLTNAVAVSAGFYHSLALRSDGTVTAWGSDVEGATNVPSGLHNIVAIAAGSRHSLALKDDGTVVQWGSDWEWLTMPEGLTNITRIAVCLTANIALRADGTVVTWGMFDYPPGPVTPPPADLTNVVAVAAGGSHFLALTADGQVVAWGINQYDQTIVPSNLRNVQAIAAGFYHNLVLTDSHPPVWQTPLLVKSNVGDNGFTAVIHSKVNSVLALEYAETLGGPVWHRLPLVAGTGGDVTLRDPSPGGQTRFYRVRTW